MVNSRGIGQIDLTNEFNFPDPRLKSVSLNGKILRCGGSVASVHRKPVQDVKQRILQEKIMPTQDTQSWMDVQIGASMSQTNLKRPVRLTVLRQQKALVRINLPSNTKVGKSVSI